MDKSERDRVVTDRKQYHSEYYRNNKARILSLKAKRYKESEENRAYHRRKSNEWYHQNKVLVGSRDRSIVMTEGGRRLYSIRYAAEAFGISIPYFRDFIRKGLIPEASYTASGKWRMYIKDQLRLLKRAAEYYRQYTNPYRMQAMLFCFWEEPGTAMDMTQDACLLMAMKQMEESVSRVDKKKIAFKLRYSGGQE